jgi:uracil-DNA glycosylase
MAAESTSAAEFVPESRSPAALRRAASGCHGCPLWEDATQTVFGAGQRKAELMLVAVKHFKWRARGKRRLHQTPRAGEVEACKP